MLNLKMCRKDAQIHLEIHELCDVSAYRISMSHAISENWLVVALDSILHTSSERTIY